MSEYTPTTEEIRRDYAAYLSMESGEEFYGDAIPEGDARARFDRMIAEVERAAAARALEEAAYGIFVSPAEIDPGKRMAFHRGADAVYDALRARAAEYRKAVQS